MDIIKLYIVSLCLFEYGYCQITKTFIINDIDDSGPTLIDEFLSITVDAGLAKQTWSAFPWNSNLANTLAKGLSPAYFRYGGTSQDEVIYNTNGNITTYSLSNSTKAVLNMSQFSDIANFASNNGWKLIFGLNAQQRFIGNNSWNPLNAYNLLNKIVETGIDHLVYGFELGNEPDLYPGNAHNGFVNVTSKQLANDFNTLYQIIYNDIYKNNDYKPKLYGCDTAFSFQYLGDFLSNISIINNNVNILSGVTWHQYYGAGLNWSISDFVNPSILDSLIPYITNSLNTISPYNKVSILGESSSIVFPPSQKDIHNITQSYIAGFLWLDKLGLASIYDIYFVARQDFWGYIYELINEEKSNYPNPDYWSSLLFKNLIGNKVIWVNNQFELNRDVRCYAFCTKTKEMGSIFNYNKGDITLMILNTLNNTINIKIKLNTTYHNNHINDNLIFDGFMLTSYPNVINSFDMFLNGNLLKMMDNMTFPKFSPITIPFDSTLNMSALSYSFFVIKNTNSSICL